MALSAHAFVAELDEENRRALAKIAEKTSAGDAPGDLTVAKLLVLALKNELEATECAAAWIATTPEIDVKLALARQAGDEAKHFRLIEKRLAALGVDTLAVGPRAANANASTKSGVLTFLLSLDDTAARVAAGQFTREALALVRNEAFIQFCRARGDGETAMLYEDIIQPDERHHHELGRALLTDLATSDDTQQRAREASARVLAIAEEIQEIARLKMGISRAPGLLSTAPECPLPIEPQMTARLRAAVPDDAAAATRIVFQALRSFGIEPDPTGIDADVTVFGSRERVAQGIDDIVADIDGTVSGLVSLEPHEGGGWVSKLFVDATHRGKGLGRALLDHAVVRGRDRGYARLGLRTRTIFTDAVRLYERSGWTRGPDPESPNNGPDRTYTLALT